MKKVINIGTNIFLILAIFILILYIGTGVASGRPNVLGYRIFHVASGSMEPVYMTGDYILVKTADADDVQVNDIVVYDRDGFSIVHRIIKETEEGFIFKGDNNQIQDPETVIPEQIQYIAIKNLSR